MSSGRSTKKKDREEAIAKSGELQAFVDELWMESDRATAILGVALLDEQFRQLFEALFVDDSKAVALLLEPERPLGAFGARVTLAYCLGLLSADELAMLIIVKNIRNRFAHHLHGLTFTSPSVATKCEKLKPYMRVPAGFEEFVDTPRKVFLRAVTSLMTRLSIEVASTSAQGHHKIPKWEVLAHYSRNPEAG